VQPAGVVARAVSKRAAWLAATLAAAIIAGGAAYWYGVRPIDLPAPERSPVTRHPSPASEDFVGDDSCAGCHQAQFAAWSKSTHGQAGGPPAQRAPALSAANVIAPFSGVLRFANARVTPRIRSDSYEFLVEQPGEPAVILTVDGVVGGGHIYGGGTQAFFTRRPDGTLRMIPFEWSRHDRVWFCNTNSRSGRGWAPITSAIRLEECGDWPPTRVLGDIARFAGCQSCHASQAVVTADTTRGGYVTTFTSLAINCESCHGPARQHLELARAGRLADDVGITSLAMLDKDASVKACYQCHALKDQLREGYRSGAPLESHYSLKLPLLGDAPLFPDGRIRTFAYQEGHSYSDCYLNGGMTCVSCHDPHGQTYRSVVGDPLVGRFDDRQCTSCHLSKGEQPALHTKHPPSVSCTSCHMPSRQEPETRALSRQFSDVRVIPYERADHTIPIPRPQLDSAYRFVSACAKCHAGMTTAQQVAQIRSWWGELKPFQPKPYARFDSLSRVLQAATPDLELDDAARRRVEALLRSGDVDERAVALATLHLTEGGKRGTRRGLASALRRDTASDGLRARWAVALGYMGDYYAGQGRLDNARIAYARAIEVRPSQAHLHLSLANAQRDAGDVAGALASYRQSLELDSRVGIAWVNYGIALGAAGDTTAAVDALRRAARLDANDPLAWFNLANIHFVRRELDSARILYERTARLDPSIATAHFQLARVGLLRRDERAALRSLRRGLAWDSSDASAREMAAVLARRASRGGG
jgi:tetratricopeptide (TPR) repeat protein